MSTQQIVCPNCGHRIDVNEVLGHQIADKLRLEFEAKAAQDRKLLSEEAAKLEAEKNAAEKLRRDLDAREKSIESLVADQVEQRLTETRAKEIALVREKVRLEEAEQRAALEQELKEKSEQVRELNRTRADLERLKREKDEMAESIRAEQERLFTEMLRQEREKIQRTETERAEMKMNESRILIEELRRQNQEMNRKIEQGSMQRQGETQEIAIEQWLQDQFPLDSVEEIKKGAAGADCLQTVNTRERARCGTIYYESKRTKNFAPSWIEKFRADIREKRADIGVLVTEALPADMDRMGFRDGVWICSFEEFKGLSAVLRQTLIQISMVADSQVNRGTKMDLLYEYLTGTEFHQQLEAIVEGFVQMKTDLEGEKRAVLQQWKKREKQIEKVLLNTTNLYGSIRGIAGAAVAPLKELEYDDGTGATDPGLLGDASESTDDPGR